MTETVVIEQGIPIPPKRRKTNDGWSKYSFLNKMNVNDSVAFTCKTGKKTRYKNGAFSYYGVLNAIGRVQKGTEGKKFVHRILESSSTVKKTSDKHIRIWRTQ